MEETILSLLTTGMNAGGYALRKMEEFVRAGEATGVSRSDFTRAFQAVQAYEREAHLKTLLDSATIRLISNPAAGRTGTIYVHQDF